MGSGGRSGALFCARRDHAERQLGRLATAAPTNPRASASTIIRVSRLALGAGSARVESVRGDVLLGRRCTGQDRSRNGRSVRLRGDGG
jgi:hypothetical protein